MDKVQSHWTRLGGTKVMTAHRPSWWERLEARRRERNESIRDVARLMGVSQQTIYNWREGGRPESSDVIRILSEYLHEDWSQLWSEMRREPDEGLDAVLRAYAARDLNALYARAWRTSIAEILDPEDPAGIELVDIVFRQLRKKLPNATLSVRMLFRGREHRTGFHYAIYVRDESVDAVALRETLEPILRRLRAPVSIEHSVELLPEQWRDGYPVVLVPVHLAARAADWKVSKRGAFLALVLGVWYSGAPDIASAVASRLGAGSDSITNVAAIAGSWDPASARTNEQLEMQQIFVAQRITSDPSPYSGPFIWANNDVPPILDRVVRDQLVHTFRGPVVVVELDDEMLKYAAYRSHTATGESVEHHFEQLKSWQAELLKIAAERKETYRDTYGEPAEVLRVLLRMPKGIEPYVEEGQQRWHDEVDAMFDAYIEAADEVVEWLDRTKS